jgi:hypothetical protein
VFQCGEISEESQNDGIRQVVWLRGTASNDNRKPLETSNSIMPLQPVAAHDECTFNANDRTLDYSWNNVGQNAYLQWHWNSCVACVVLWMFHRIDELLEVRTVRHWIYYKAAAE